MPSVSPRFSQAIDVVVRLVVADDESCVRCLHAGVHHSGPCQACLRELRDGHLTVDVPCGRFGRRSPRTRWERLRAGSLP